MSTSRDHTTERTSAAEFLRGVRSELSMVVWPTRGAVTRLSKIVLVTLAVIMALIFFLDFAFAKSILSLFEA